MSFNIINEDSLLKLKPDPTYFLLFSAASASNGGNGLSHREGMLIAESQRMKHELKILQKKISNLNLAKMSNGPNAWETENGMLPTTGMGEKVAANQMCHFILLL